MKNECNIIRDILPLYAENMVSPDTVEFVEEHLKNCVECQKEYKQIKEPETIHSKTDVVPLVNLKRKMRKKKIQTVTFTIILVAALLVSAFAFMSAPEFFPYSDDLMSITENADKSITITFDEKITDYSCQFYLDPDSEIGSVENGRYCYHIEAWTSFWDRSFSKRGVQSTTIQPKQGFPFTVYYSSNNGEPDACVYGQPLIDNGGIVTLPRLVLGYYLIFAFACFTCLFIFWFVFRRKENVRIWIERIIIYPISYVLGHFIVLGFKTISYSTQRDFMLIVFLSVLIYCGLLLAHNIYQLCKELRANRNAEHFERLK